MDKKLVKIKIDFSAQTNMPFHKKRQKYLQFTKVLPNKYIPIRYSIVLDSQHKNNHILVVYNLEPQYQGYYKVIYYRPEYNLYNNLSDAS